jgi:hypothetical protein
VCRAPEGALNLRLKLADCLLSVCAFTGLHATAIWCCAPACSVCRASKAALNIINKALVMDLKEQQVECVLLHPGYVKTDMTGVV